MQHCLVSPLLIQHCLALTRGGNANQLYRRSGKCKTVLHFPNSRKCKSAGHGNAKMVKPGQIDSFELSSYDHAVSDLGWWVLGDAIFFASNGLMACWLLMGPTWSHIFAKILIFFAKFFNIVSERKLNWWVLGDLIFSQQWLCSPMGPRWWSHKNFNFCSQY